MKRNRTDDHTDHIDPDNKKQSTHVAFWKKLEVLIRYTGSNGVVQQVDAMAAVFHDASATLTEEQKQHVSSLTTASPHSTMYPRWMIDWVERLERLSAESKQGDEYGDDDDSRCILDISLPLPLNKLRPILQSPEFPPDFEDEERDDSVEHGKALFVVRLCTRDDTLTTIWVPRPSRALFAAFQRVHKLYVHDGDVFTHQGDTIKSANPLNPLANDLNNWLSDQKFPRVPYGGQCPLSSDIVHFDFVL
jgi:hypothetical protein